MKTLQKEDSAVGKPSEELLTAIDRINLLPTNIEMPDIHKFEYEVSLKYKDLLAGNFETEEKYQSARRYVETEIYHEALNKCLINLPSDFCDYIYRNTALFNENDPKSYKSRFVSVDPLAVWLSRRNEYISFYNLRQDFIKLFLALKGLMEEPERFRVEASEFYDEFWNLPELRVQVTIDPETNTLKTVPIGAAALIDGADVSRLRICKACNKFFWAFRKDVSGCSPKCCQAYRTRKHRDKQKNRFLPRRHPDD